MKNSLFLLGAAAVVALSSCSQSEVMEVAENRAIGFNAFVGNPTKAVTNLENTNLEKFFVFGDFNEGKSVAFDNTGVNGGKVGDQSEWTPENTAYWTIGQAYKFGAYSNGNNGLTKNDQVSFNDGTLTIENYEVNDENDLIAATAEVTPSTGEEKVDLTFKHLLSKIKFTFSTTAVPEAYKMEVTSIKFNGIKTEAGCTFTNNTVSEWNGSTAEYIVPKLTDYAITGGKASTDDILVIPQANNTIEATITIKMIDEKSNTTIVEAKEFKANLTADENSWKAGYVYNYTAKINPDDVNSDLKEIKFTVKDITVWDTTSKPETGLIN